MSMRLLSRAIAASPEGQAGSHESSVRSRRVSDYRMDLVAAGFPMASRSPSPGWRAPANSGVEQVQSFYDLINDLTREYDLVRGRLGELNAENSTLRRELHRLSAGITVATTPLEQRPCAEVRLRLLSEDKGKPQRARRTSVPQVLPGLKRDCNQGSLPKPLEPESPRPPPMDSPRSLPPLILQDQDGQFMADRLPTESTATPETGQPHHSDVVGQADNNTSRSGDMPQTVVSFVAASPSYPEHQEAHTPKANSFTLNQDSLTSSAAHHDSQDEGERKSFESVFSLESNEDDLPMAKVNTCEFQVLPAWTKKGRKNIRRNSVEDTKSHNSADSITSLVRQQLEQDSLCYSPAATFMMEYVILRPNSRICVLWDLITVLILIYDLIVIPLQVYELPESDVWMSMEMAVTSCWTIDICLSFFKGYEMRGEIEMHPQAIAKHYMKTWFGFDISIVGVDWALFLLESGDDVEALLRFSRFRRILRLLRVARLLKVGARFLAKMNGASSTTSTNGLLMRLLGLLTVLVAINHFIACGWYAIGSLSVFDEAWTQKAFQRDDHFFYRYTTSFHWSVTQFTPASMEVVPRNPIERLYTIVCIFFGLLMFSSFVSNMTSSMTLLSKLNAEKRQSRDILMGYMNARKLSYQLRDDILSFLSSASRLKQRAHCEQDVSTLKSLPPGILTKLHMEIHVPVLQRHAFFKHCLTEEPAMVYRLCHRAMSERALTTGEELFRFGVRCSRMYFTNSGECKYVVGFGEQLSYTVGPQQWLCEACLWVEWEHRGVLTAKTACEISQLDATEFATIMTRSDLIFEIQRYARMYAHYSERDNGGSEWVTDIWGQKLRVMDLVQKAFKPDDTNTDSVASKMLLLWSGDAIGTDRVFAAWKKWMKKEQRKKRWWYRWSMGWFGRLLTERRVKR